MQKKKKKNAPELEQKVLLYSAIFCLVLFIALGLFFGIAAIHYSSDTESIKPDVVMKLVSIVTDGKSVNF